MFGLGTLSRTQRFILGVFVLLLVDIIWVASSEITKYLFNQEHYSKPYFNTYIKTSMFFLYLTGFLWWRGWWLQCTKKSSTLTSKDIEECKLGNDEHLSDPVFVPVKFDERYSSSAESDDATNLTVNGRGVHFSQVSEVRHLTDMHAEEAKLSRLSYHAYVRAEEARVKAASKLTVKQVAKVAVIFCFVFFFGNLAYQEAMRESEEGLVHVLSSTSGLFTLVLAAIFPSTSGDRITLSKLVAVALSIGGVVLVSLSGRLPVREVPLGALWALCGALLYAIYLVLMRRRVDNEEKLNIPMFFGFLGFFTALFLWPGILILHFTGAEQFEWPDRLQWFLLVVNGVIGTVLSELLWLWGCFLTSSLVATLALTLTVPMTVMAEICFGKDVSHSWMLYVGSCPVFLSFFGVSILSHYDNWDPVLLLLKKCIQCICRRRLFYRGIIRDMDREQSESLISINGENSS